MKIIKKAIKNSEKINKDFIKSSQLPQQKSYLKILGLSYFSGNTNKSITSQLVEKVLKESHIFKDVEFCYDLKLGSDCNSDKDLSKNEGYD